MKNVSAILLAGVFSGSALAQGTSPTPSALSVVPVVIPPTPSKPTPPVTTMSPRIIEILPEVVTPVPKPSSVIVNAESHRTIGHQSAAEVADSAAVVNSTGVSMFGSASGLVFGSSTKAVASEGEFGAPVGEQFGPVSPGFDSFSGEPVKAVAK